MSNPIKDPLRTFSVDVEVIYTTTRLVRSRTIAGARAAARASAEADYPGTEIRPGYPQEKRSGER